MPVAVVVIVGLLVMAIGGAVGLLLVAVYLAVPVAATAGALMGMRRAIAGRPPNVDIYGPQAKRLDDWQRKVVPADLAYALAVAVVAPTIYVMLAGEYQGVDGMWRGRLTHEHRIAALVLFTAVPTGAYALVVGVAKLFRSRAR